MSVLICEYIWIDAYGNLRSKNRTLTIDKSKLDDTIISANKYLNFIPQWNFDGSSTGQAPTEESEVWLRPVRVFHDPFRVKLDGVVSLLVLCSVFEPNGSPNRFNNRFKSMKVFETRKHEASWYGLEQEFFIIDVDTGKPLGLSDNSRPQGPYYCGVGANNAFGRSLVNEAYIKCLYAGINVSGMNGEVAPGQWEIQVGPVQGVDAADQVWMLRYILGRVSEDYSERTGNRVIVDFGAKPVSGDWNGSGMHVNFSTESMRSEGGYQVILECMDLLKVKHKEHLECYGEDNSLRLTGKHETSDMKNFTWSVGGRNTSVRIPTMVFQTKKGYFEDRRPSSSADPYLITSKLLETCCKPAVNKP
jgi:glutamine synthetase